MRRTRPPWPDAGERTRCSRWGTACRSI